MHTKPRVCAVMQPTYLPWAGYFNLIAQADVFVFHDDVQIQKQSWHNRNRILVQDEPFWLTVPCHRQGVDQRIMDVETDERPGLQNWRRKHARLLLSNYARHPQASVVKALAEKLMEMLQTDPGPQLLADLNIGLIEWMAEHLELKTQFVRASSLRMPGCRSEKLVNFCRHFGCETYLSPVGSADYLAEDGDFERSPVALVFQDFQPPAYPQRGQGDFISHLSLIDVLANVGWENARDYVRTGAVQAVPARERVFP